MYQMHVTRKHVAVILLALLALFSIVLWRQRTHLNLQACGNTNEDPPLVFISGQQSSGTGLMRIILDAHPSINCGAEPIYGIRVLAMRHAIEQKNKDWVLKANIYPVAIDQATKAYLRELAIHMVEPTYMYCQKQPLMFQHLEYLAGLFPTAKFILLVRDGRAAVASSIERHLVDGKDPLQKLRNWDKSVRQEINQCQNVGSERCYIMIYEKLVLSPEEQLRKLLDFLGVPWDPIVLKHDKILDQLSYLNPHEASTKQFTKPIHTESLGKWAKESSPFTEEELERSLNEAPLLNELGYNLPGIPPDYTKLPKTVPAINNAN